MSPLLRSTCGLLALSWTLLACAAAGPAKHMEMSLAPGDTDSLKSQPFKPSADPSASTGDSPSVVRLVVYNGSVDLAVPDKDDIDPTCEKIRALAEELGGYMQGRNASEITVKVPAAKFHDFISRLDKLGAVGEKRVFGQDVTDEYQDLMIRLDNAEKARDRYLKLLEAAANVGEAVAVEKELERVTVLVEELKGQLRRLSNQIQFATVTVRVEEEVTPGPLGWIFYGVGWAIYHLFVW